MSSVGQVVGGAIGFFAAGPLGFSAIAGAQAGIMLGGLIDPPKGPNIVGPRLSDLSVQTSTYGAPLPRIYGTVATFGNIFWLEGDKLKETSKKNKSGGKGGGGGSTTKTFSYSATFAVGLCEGPIDGIRRLWIGAKLIYDAGSDDLETIIASNEAATGFKLYHGTDDQSPDPRMQADKGVANTPAYRGRAYIVMYDYPLADHGNSLVAAQLKAEVVKVAAPPQWVISSLVGVPTVTTDASLKGFLHSSHYQEWRGRIYLGHWTTSYASSAVSIYDVVPDGGHYKVAQINLPSTASAFCRGESDEPCVFIRNHSVGTRYYLVTGEGLATTHNTTLTHGASQARFSKKGSRLYITTSAIFNQGVSVFHGEDLVLSKSLGYYFQGIASTDDRIYLLRTGSTPIIHVLDAETLDEIEVWTGPAGAISTTDSNTAFCVGGDGKAYILEAVAGALNGRISTLSGAGYSVVVAGLKIPSNITWVGLEVQGGVYWISGHESASDKVVLHAGNFIEDYYGVPLSSIVQAESLQSQVITEADVDVSDLTDEVRGYRVAQPGAIRGAIDPLQAAWPFDIVQSGYQIKFLRRGKASVATIPATQLDARPFGDAPTQELMTVREMDLQLPREVSLKYLDVNREYDQGEQRDARMNTEAINRRDLDLAIVMNADEAKQTAEVLLYLWWLERYDATFRLPPEYIGLEPADVITVTGKWGEYELRLTTISYLPDGRLECQAKYNTATIYTSTAVGEEGSSGGATIGLTGPSAYRLLDIPLLTDSLNTPGFPAAMSGYTDSWPGGVLFRSGDGGQTFDDIQGFTAPVSMAFARGTIGAGPTNVIDAASALTVDVLSGDLESVSELQMLNGANHFAYGADGRWEIIAAQNAVEQVDGSFLLTNFLRGRFGTEWAMTTHVAGDALVLVSDPDMAWIAMNSGLIGQMRIYRGVTVGKDISTDSDREFTYQGVNLKPLSPVYLNGSRHPSTNDWTLTWIRRGRVSPEWRDLVDVPLGEDTEAYEIDVFSNSGYTAVVRTISVTAQTAAYTSAQQVTDFGSSQSTLYLRVYQMSATIGRGYPLETSITR